ncbi:MAG: hypothetical protein CMO12_04780 [Thaumarchaeota archaeon]|nr:hypothetical protein [Nitrososphaerota archaeon]|tara:strand:- start:3875 stop:4273 length:399 start_codon:yes stop_codon:yes gene_type:complete
MYEAVSSVIVRGDKILLLHRSQKVRTNQGKWSVVSGELEQGQTVIATALNEIREETKLQEAQVNLLRTGDGIIVKPKPDSETLVHLLLFESSSWAVTINWEHDESRWVSLAELEDFDLVPEFDSMLASLQLF